MARFHVVAPMHTSTTEAFADCPFTMNAVKFAWMMKSFDHDVFVYAGGEEKGLAPCNEHVGCDHNIGRAVQEISRRLEPQDFVCLFYGDEQRPVRDAFQNHFVVEPAMGYRTSCARFRVFPSYAWMHTIYGAEEGKVPHPRPMDEAVIPHQIFPWDHPFVDEPDDYVLFMGRAVWDKGLHVAEQVCERAGVRLVVAGEARSEIGQNIGQLLPVTRAAWMSHARALLIPTLYVEPFGLVAVEAMACGTPVIAPDWGAFSETVDERVGVRCRSLSEYVQGVERVASLDRSVVRRLALERWSVERVRHEFQAYFDRLSTLWDKGWAA